MSTEQERTDFEAWYHRQYIDSAPLIWAENVQAYRDFDHNQLFGAYQAGRAAQRSRPKVEPSEWLLQHEALMNRVSKAAIVVGYGGKINGAPAEQTLKNAENALLDHARTLQSQDREDAPFLQEDDQHALHRFIETTEDGQGYDIGKDRIKRLAELGVVRNEGFGRYSVTIFGHWRHEKYWHQNPSLPLKTIDEHNADAAIDLARRVEGEEK